MKLTKFPRVRSGEALTPRHYNLLAAELERLNRLEVVGASFFANGPEGIKIILGSTGSPDLFAKATGGSIAAGGATPQTVTLANLDSTLKTGQTRIVVNPHPTVAVPSNAYCWINVVDGVWAVKGWFC